MAFTLPNYFFLLFFITAGLVVAFFYILLLALCLGAGISLLRQHHSYQPVNAFVNARETISFRSSTGTLYRLKYYIGGQKYLCQLLLKMSYRTLSLRSRTTLYVSDQDPLCTNLEMPSPRNKTILLFLGMTMLWASYMIGGALSISIDWVNPALVVAAIATLTPLFLILLFWSQLHQDFLASLRILFYPAAQSVICDYYIYSPDPINSDFVSDMPVISLSIEGTFNGRSYQLKLPTTEIEPLMRSLELPEQLPSFWYVKQEWDQLLLGRPITVRLAPDLSKGLLLDTYKHNRYVFLCGLSATFIFISLVSIGLWTH